MVINTKIPNRLTFNKLFNTFVLKAWLCACVLLSTFSSYGQNSVESLMALYAEEGQHNRIESPFNGVMLVAKGDNILLKKAYGFHDQGKNISLTTDSRFLIGSVTKQFTAMLVMQQVENGAIALDKTINDYLPYFPDDKGKELTIHRLLSHTSGLPHYEGLRRLNIRLDRFREDVITVKSYAQLIAKMDLINKPGTQFYYSSMNYVLLGAVLEQVTGQSFSQLIQEKIAKPLKLNNTGYADNKYIENYVAKGYTFTEGGFFESLFFDKKGEYKESRFRHQSTAYSTGGMHSTIDDLYLWSQAVKQHTILSKEMTDKMFTPNLGGYGYGWFVNHENMIRFNPSIQLLSHGGSLEGYSSNVALYKDGTTVIYLANVAPVGSIRLTMNMHLAAQNIEIDEFERDIILPNVNDGLAGFLDAGGISALRAYYQEISARAGYQVLMSEWTYQELIKLYLVADDLVQAELFFNEMLSHHSTPNKRWLNTIGYDFLEADAFKLAIKSFEINRLNHQYSASAFDGLGDGYRENGQYKLAKENYQQAVKLAKSNQSKHATYYQEQLESVRELAEK
ncbi:MAG: serine hydrolase [Colwellia sp.]|nr:serine hydrolase [Colwellia sp.]